MADSSEYNKGLESSEGVHKAKEVMTWTIREVDARALPPLAVGYYKEIDGDVVFEAVAYCFEIDKAEILKEILLKGIKVEDWLSKEQG